MISIMAVAMTYVLAAGEIDLSIGMVAGLISLVAAVAMDHYGTSAASSPASIGGLVGLINGLLTTRIGIPSFLTTLAMMGIATRHGDVDDADQVRADPRRRLYLAVRRRQPGADPGPGHLDADHRESSAMLCFAARPSGAGCWRPAAARPRPAIAASTPAASRCAVLIISSLGAAIAGMLYAGRLHSGRFQLGEGDELSVIAAAVLGGTSLFGGAGIVVGSIVGSLMIGVINNGLLLMGLEYSQQLIARGIIIIVAVAISQSRK